MPWLALREWNWIAASHFAEGFASASVEKRISLDIHPRGHAEGNLLRCMWAPFSWLPAETAAAGQGPLKAKKKKKKPPHPISKQPVATPAASKKRKRADSVSAPPPKQKQKQHQHQQQQPSGSKPHQDFKPEKEQGRENEPAQAKKVKRNTLPEIATKPSAVAIKQEQG
jgi:hypothetical protein